MAISPQEFANLQALIAQQNQTRVLLEFKAGMMNLNGFTVTADPRRGTVRLVVQESLVHLQWTQRPGGQLENANDLLLFPGSAVWEPVPECKTGRVYLLRFLNSSRKRFFWMQEPSADKDDEYTKDINKYINNPPAAGNNMQVDPGLMSEFGGDETQLIDMINQSHAHSAAPTTPPASSGSRSTAASASASAARPAASTSAASAAPASGSSSSTTSSTGAARPAAATSASAAGASAGAAGSTGTGQIPINVNNLANVLQQFANQMQAQQQQQQELQDPLTLRNVLESDRVLAILNDDEKLVQSLLPYLPEGQRDAENLRSTLRSPQLYQTLARMTSLLNSAQCGALMASLGLPVSDIGMRAFIKAVQDLSDKESKQQSTPAPSSASASASASTSSSSASSSSSSTSSQSAPSQSSSSSSQPSSGSSSGTQSNNPDPTKKS